MKILKVNLFVCLVFLFFVGRANEYFVSNAGNDNHNGTKKFPFKSIFQASEAAFPGDTVTILEGEYQLRKQFRPVRSGNPATSIKWKYEPSPWFGAFKPIEK